MMEDRVFDLCVGLAKTAFAGSKTMIEPYVIDMKEQCNTLFDRHGFFGFMNSSTLIFSVTGSTVLLGAFDALAAMSTRLSIQTLSHPY